MTVRFACERALVSDEASRQHEPDEQLDHAWEIVDGEPGETAAVVVAQPASVSSTASGAKSDVTPPHSAQAVGIPVPEGVAVCTAVREATVQLQLHYTLPSGEKMLSVIESTRPLCTDRSQAEAQLQSTITSLATIHRAAGLAQHGHYGAARLQLISTQRLLQRTMRTSAQQQDYMSYVVQAEKLDQFMREVSQQEAVFGSKRCGERQRHRDDEAAKAMYQMKSVSSVAFHAR